MTENITEWRDEGEGLDEFDLDQVWETPRLNKAMVAARAEIENPSKGGFNPHFKNKFVTLSGVIDQTAPILAQHGLTVHQDLQTISDFGVACYTHVCHESGEEKLFGPLSLPFTKRDPQGYASASTYARRYHLMAVLGIAGDDDDDAQDASRAPKKMPKHRAAEYAELLDAVDLETGAGVESFGEAWLEMDSDEQASFAPWFSVFWQGEVTKAKAKAREAITRYRKEFILNQEEK